MTRPEVVGKNPLPLFRNCFDMNIKCPTMKWRGNYQHNIYKQTHSKKRHLDTLVAKGKRKVRKKLEFVDTVSYSVFWGTSYTVFWGFRLNIIYVLRVVKC